MIADNPDLEGKLQKLIEIGTTHNAAGIKDFKRQGGRVVGMLAGLIPEEILYAASKVLPWHVIGTMEEATPLAGVHRSPATDAFTNHVLESLLNGELDFLDALVTTNYDDDTKTMEYFARFYRKPHVSIWLEVPGLASKLAIDQFTGKLATMRVQVAERLGTWLGAEIRDTWLRDAIKEYNTSRKLLHQLYEMRKKDKPPLTGCEVWGIVSAAMSMPQHEFIQQLEPLIPYIEQRQPSYKNGNIRIMVSSDFLHNIGYLKIIEDLGGVITMDDLDTGSGYFWDMVDEESEPVHALAERYLGPLRSPRFVNWEVQVDQILEWIKEFRIDGFIEMPVLQSLSRLFRGEYLHRTLEEAGIPHLNIPREYHLANVAQITTRVQAFLEMVSQKK